MTLKFQHFLQDLRRNYVHDVQTLQKHVRAVLKPKTVEGHVMTAPGFVQLLRFLVHAANNGSHAQVCQKHRISILNQLELLRFRLNGTVFSTSTPRRPL